ncbi:MAG: hypothetical protein ABR879_00540 [Methanomassiliicoccales archaeon]|jgi:hypothetical protein
MSSIELELSIRLKSEANSENLARITKILSELLNSNAHLEADLSTMKAADMSTSVPAMGGMTASSDRVARAGTLSSITASDQIQSQVKLSREELPDLIVPPPQGSEVRFVDSDLPAPDARGRLVGSWGQFNSFFPILAAVRIASNLELMGRKDLLVLDQFVRTSIDQFKARRLSKARGFPSSEKPTAGGRYVWHFLITAHEMGLIRLQNHSETHVLPWSLTDWDLYTVDATRYGYKLATLPSRFLDQHDKDQLLDPLARDWITSYLRKIDSQGYAESSLLRDIVSYLKHGHDGKADLRAWLQTDERFRKYVASWSRKAGSANDKEIADQLSNLAATFAGSKIALLRELGVVDPRRNNYDVVGILDNAEGAP